MPISQCPLQQLMTFKIRPESEDLQPGFAPPSVAPLEYPLRTSAQHAPAYLRLGHVEHISFHATLCPSRHSGFSQAQSVNTNSNQVKVLESRSRGYGDPGLTTVATVATTPPTAFPWLLASGFWLTVQRHASAPLLTTTTITATTKKKKKKKKPGL